jgi:ribosomal RNA assembly protein
METLFVSKTIELKRTKPDLEKAFNVKIDINGKQVAIDGEAVDEFEAAQVVEAIGFGFSAKKALLLKDPDYTFRRISIKDFTRRKNLEDVRARIIGKQGKTKKTIEDISGVYLELNNNEVGLIGPAEDIEQETAALTNLIKGTKQANVYQKLEKINTEKKKHEFLK